MEEKNNGRRKIVLCVAFIFAIMAVFWNVDSTGAATEMSVLQAQYPSGTTGKFNYKNKASQCHGFACLMADRLTDTDPYIWSRVGNFNQLKAGDIIRFNRPHSILVTGVSGDTVTYADCNWVAANMVKWGQSIQKSKLIGKFGSLSAVWVCPKNIFSGNNVVANVDTGNRQIPSIQGVTIKGINKDSVSFSYKVDNGSMSKIHIESILTGQVKELTYTSGLTNISYTFNRSDFPLGGSQYKIYLYAYSGNSGHYGNEQVHKMRYGSTTNIVTFPNLMSNDQFKQMIFREDWYADMYGDLKAAFGYNETALWNHFVQHGASEGRIGIPGFSAVFYLKTHADVAKAYGAKNYAMAIYHYMTYGIYENRIGSPVFQAGYYLSHNKDLENAFGKKNYVQAAVHFGTYGITENRVSSVYYCGKWYKSHNADLQKMSAVELLRHYYQFGIKEKRFANVERKIPN